MEGGLVWLAAAVALVGVALLRWSWSRKRRSAALNAAGWAAFALAMVVAGMEAGAWGVSVASMAAMGGALLLLATAAATSPPGRERITERRARILPDAGEPLHLGRRVLTFAEVVIGGLAASIALGVTLQISTRLIGWSEANANAAALLVVPLVWGILACALLMQDRHRTRHITLVLAIAPLLPALLAGS